jgi:hypothetical protein
MQNDIRVLQNCVAQLKAKPDPQLDVETLTVRCVYEYDIDENGAVTGSRGNGPPLSVSWPANSPAIINFGSGLTNPSAIVQVTGDIGTGDSAGLVANAFISQDIGFSSSTQLTFSLFSGDDGGGADDLSRRAVTVMVFEDKQVLVNAELN